MKRITFYSNELSDTYALRTLYDYVKPHLKTVELSFYTLNPDSDRERMIIGKKNISSFGILRNSDYVVCALSDITTKERVAGVKNLLFDIAVLKNCSLPLSETKRNKLKKMYKLEDGPVSVVGFAEQIPNLNVLNSLAENLSKSSNVYFIYRSEDHMREKHLITSFKNSHFVSANGNLKDYYAISSLALNGSNMGSIHANLHNFIEATEGGPFYLHPPRWCAQYGYDELVKFGSIVECKGLDNIIHRSRNFLEEGVEKFEKVKEKRKRHIKETREKYLPFFLEAIDSILSKKMPKSMKDFAVTYNENFIAFKHKKTQWSKNTHKYDGGKLK